MKKQAICLALAFAMSLSLASVAFADLTTLTGNHVFFNVANDNGVKFDWDGAKYGIGPNNDYYILADGGGLNQLHITTDVNSVYGQVTSVDTKSTNPSGTFYISTTGGRGFNDDIILLASVKGPILDDFALHITSSGYNWTVNQDYNIMPTTYNYVAGALNETFTKDDFIYGPQTVKPGPIKEGTLPLYYGQDFNDPSTAEYLMFIDLYAGNFSKPETIDQGDVKVEYSFTGMNSFAAFNAYAWAGPGKDAQGVNWTTRTNGTVNYSGYSINYTGAPVPVPAAAWLLGSGLSGMFFLRRKRTGPES
jgi:hypothetical protein